MYTYIYYSNFIIIIIIGTMIIFNSYTKRYFFEIHNEIIIGNLIQLILNSRYIECFINIIVVKVLKLSRISLLFSFKFYKICLQP